jgi:hypothetical protein
VLDHASSRTINRRPAAGALWLLASFTALVATTPVWAQRGDKNENGAVALLLLPLVVVAVTSLHVALMTGFPRLSARCGIAVRRYRWQTALTGLGALLVLLIVAGLVSGIAQPLSGIPLTVGLVAALLGSTGVSLEAGKWAVARIDANNTPHPVVQIITGSSLLGWSALLVPVAGQVALLVAFFMSIGGFAYALFFGQRLDEAPARQAVIPETGATVATPVPAPPPSPTPSPGGGVPGPPPGETKPQGYGDQVF